MFLVPCFGLPFILTQPPREGVLTCSLYTEEESDPERLRHLPKATE